MERKHVPLILLSWLFIIHGLTISALGADKSLKPLKDRPSLPPRLAPVYSFPCLTGSEYTPPPPPPQKVILRTDKAGDGIIETVGNTTFDYQHNCTMGRQVEHRAGYSDPFTPYGHYIHFDWMAQTGNVFGQDRGIGYQAYNLTDCGTVFDQGGIRIETAFAGYVTMDAHNIDAMNSWAVPSAHQNEDQYHAKAFWDFQAGGPVFGVFTSDANITDIFGWWQNPGTGPGNQNIWPKIDWDIDGAEEILHMVTTELGGGTGEPQTCSYYRRVGPYGTGNGFWSDQRLIDTVMSINVTVASSPISDKIAIIWNAPVDYLRDRGTAVEFASQYNNDIWFAIAADNGAAWENDPSMPGGESPSIGNTVDLGIGGGYIPTVGGNLTTYAPENNYKAFSEISALWYIDDLEDDYLQIIWGCRRWDDTTLLYRRSSALFHWNQKTDIIRTVVKADWDTGGACYAHAWGSDVAKITISQCDGKLYALFSQFGDRDHPCAWYEGVNNIMSGYLYMSVFDPSYDAWDRAQKITSVTENPTPCVPGTYVGGPGDCNSEYWASMARYGRLDTCNVDPVDDVLDIVYINDYWPGGCIQPGEGEWTINPVNRVVYPCREAVPEPLYDDDAGSGYGLCTGNAILTLGTTDETTFTLTLENNGILDNNFTIDAEITGSNGPGNGSNTTIGVFPYAGTITGRCGTIPIEVTITTTGEDNDVSVCGNITITHEAEGSPRIIPLCITVTDYYQSHEWAVIATPAKGLWMDNISRMGNGQSNQTLDFITDPDDCADIYLNDGSTIICRDDEGIPHCYFSVFDGEYTSDHAFRPTYPLYVDSENIPDFTYAVAEFITGDSAIGVTVEYFAPKSPEYADFIIKQTTVWNLTDVTLSNVTVGEVLDWDIPSYPQPSDNESDYDASRFLIYQLCSQSDPCDTLEQCGRAGGVAAYEGNPFKNYMTLENDVYVYTNGPFGDEAPLPDDTMYGLMAGTDGFAIAQTDSAKDIFSLTTFGLIDLVPDAEKKKFIEIIISTAEDILGTILKSIVDTARQFIETIFEWFSRKQTIDVHLTKPPDTQYDVIVQGTVNCKPKGKPISKTVSTCTTVPVQIPKAANDILLISWRTVGGKTVGSFAKYAAPKKKKSDGLWEMMNLSLWTFYNSADLDSLPVLFDSTGGIDELYYFVNIEEWLVNPKPFQDQYEIVDGTCPDLPGYLIGTTPIVFDSLAGPDENPFSTTPFTGTLEQIGASRLKSAGEALCDCMPGEANGDNQVNIGDAVYIINYVFKGGAAPTPYPRCSGDANGDCQCNIADAVYIISYVFKGGAAPVSCGSWVEICGLPFGK